MVERSIVLRRLQSEPEMDAVRGAVEWLSQEGTRPVSSEPVRVTVNEAARLWELRHQTALAKGQQIIGAEEFLSRIRGLAKNKKLEQFGFIGPTLAGNIFFDLTGKFVGFVLAQRSRKAA